MKKFAIISVLNTLSLSCALASSTPNDEENDLKAGGKFRNTDTSQQHLQESFLPEADPSDFSVSPVHKRAILRGRNPRTGEVIVLYKDSPPFLAGKALRDKLKKK